MTRAELARWGEDLACSYLETEGLRVVGRRFRANGGEVDIVAWEGEVLVFVEVKSWSRFVPETLERALSARKRRRIARAALGYLTELGLDPQRTFLRFDLILIHGEMRPEAGGPCPGVSQHLKGAWAIDEAIDVS